MGCMGRWYGGMPLTPNPKTRELQELGGSMPHDVKTKRSLLELRGLKRVRLLGLPVILLDI